jgi:hypothetical protein
MSPRLQVGADTDALRCVATIRGMPFHCVRCASYGPNVERGSNGRMLCEPCRDWLAQAHEARERTRDLTLRHPAICDNCGEVYVATRSWQRYCGSRCRIRAHRAAKRVGV